MSNRIVVVVTGITSGIAFADMLAVNTALHLFSVVSVSMLPMRTGLLRFIFFSSRL